ncbi:hypothetical protein ACIA8K_09245 [Catenuloplanes sp. NPDC051500]|uniref:hypothetical protein n=1 Tax=Catenuloplanes sp. NPDC051500 TaxID=3363959 RepID=UPI0037BE10A3
MAIRTWGRVLLTSLGVSLLVGAGQLGIAYGFGLVRFGRTFTNGLESQWSAQLTWVTWCAIAAAVTGALAAERAAHRLGHDGGLPMRAGIVIVSAAGAATVALITMPAARTAQLADGADPVTAVGFAALLGAAAGLPLAALVLWQRAYAWALISVTAATWLLAIGSAVPAFGPVRLGVLDPAALSTGLVQRLAVVVMPSLALIAGAAVGTIAGRLQHHPVIVATSGLLGPAPLTAAYLIAGPGAPSDAYQAAPFWGSLVAVAAGALGSMLATIIPRSPNPPDPDQEPPGVRGERADPPAGPVRAERPAPVPATGSRPSRPVPSRSGAAEVSDTVDADPPAAGRTRPTAGRTRPATGRPPRTTKAPTPDANLDPARHEPSDTEPGVPRHGPDLGGSA